MAIGGIMGDEELIVKATTVVDFLSGSQAFGMCATVSLIVGRICGLTAELDAAREAVSTLRAALSGLVEVSTSRNVIVQRRVNHAREVLRATEPEQAHPDKA